MKLYVWLLDKNWNQRIIFQTWSTLVNTTHSLCLTAFGQLIMPRHRRWNHSIPPTCSCQKYLSHENPNQAVRYVTVSQHLQNVRLMHPKTNDAPPDLGSFCMKIQLFSMMLATLPSFTSTPSLLWEDYVNIVEVRKV